MSTPDTITKVVKYCAASECFTIQEWGVVSQIAGVVVGLLVAGFGLYKTVAELKRLRQQREKDRADTEIAARLKRTEFLLAQHRRLFDDDQLSRVLSLLDDDHSMLAKEEMWDLNRKFLTFIEEISLLVESKLLDADVAYYMFGYYAICARDGENFNAGINPSEEHWRMFYRFCSNAEKFLANFRADLTLVPKI